jgi:hypothetical protein
MMFYAKMGLAVFMVISLSIAVDINISGKVTDMQGIPLPGATVTLEKSRLSTISGNNGDFVLTGTANIIKQVRSNQNEFSVKAKQGLLNVKVAKSSEMEITSYSLKGALVSKTKILARSGSNLIRLPELGAGVYLHEIRLGKNMIIVKSLRVPYIPIRTSSCQ